MQKIVLQSIDSPRRDFEWRLYMAKVLLDHGFESVIGTKQSIKRVHQLSKNCIFLGRLNSNSGRSKKDKEYIKDMELRNTALFFWHDEGALFSSFDYSSSVKRIYPYEFFDCPAFEKILFWGERQSKEVEGVVGEEVVEKFKVVGAPRFDLFRKTVSSLNDFSNNEERDGYTLVCGRFALANKVEEDPGGLSPRLLSILSSGYTSLGEANGKEMALDFMFNNWRKITIEFAEFVFGIYKLAVKFPGEKFIVRPHPSERESTYREAFQDFDNVSVDKSGDAHPFILGAKAVIHSECTTGLEAAFCGKPVINLRPASGVEDLEAYSVVGVSEVGELARNADELCKCFGNLKEKGFRGQVDAADVEEHVYNVPGNASASDLIVQELIEFSETNKDVSVIKHGRGIRRVVALIKELLVSLRSIGSSAVGGDSKKYLYSKKDINNLWNKWGGDPKNIRIENGVVYVTGLD